MRHKLPLVCRGCTYVELPKVNVSDTWTTDQSIKRHLTMRFGLWLAALLAVAMAASAAKRKGVVIKGATVGPLYTRKEGICNAFN